MTVYVESNFVLEQALQQEQHEACDGILRLAESGRINLLIPAFSLAEPHQALSAKEKARNRVVNDLRGHIREIGRSKRHHAVPNEFAPFASVLVRSAEQERAGLQQAIKELLRIANVIPLDAEILNAAIALQAELGMSGQDAIVLASVLHHLSHTTPSESCFLSRNLRDFDDPDVRDRLDHFACRYFAGFEAALQHILTRVFPSGNPLI